MRELIESGDFSDAINAMFVISNGSFNEIFDDSVDDEVEVLETKITNLKYDDQASREEAISLIRSLIERIDITPGEKRGQPQVQLVGGLAAILEFALAKQQRTAIPSDGGFGRVFMVAGAGFEPATFRL